MSTGQKYISILTSNGFNKMPWNKCPQGFEKANYPCYSHKEKNIWAEVYLSDPWPYLFIVGGGIKPQHIDDPQRLKELLK